MKRRHVPSKTDLIARLHRGLRPKLDHAQLRDLALVHAANLDTICNGGGTNAVLYDIVAGVLTWSRVAELLGTGVDEMTEQLQMVERVVARYIKHKRVAFDGVDYQIAKRGLDIMDALAAIADRATAIAAADWSERRMNEMAADGELCSAVRLARVARERESEPA